MFEPCEAIPDDRQLVRYLLGLLPEEDADRLDEQSIVLDEVAARLSCVENDLVDAYVSGALEADILERFESFYLTSPQRCEKVKFAERFLAALDRLRTPAAGASHTASSVPPEPPAMTGAGNNETRRPTIARTPRHGRWPIRGTSAAVLLLAPRTSRSQTPVDRRRHPRR